MDGSGSHSTLAGAVAHFLAAPLIRSLESFRTSIPPLGHGSLCFSLHFLTSGSPMTLTWHDAAPPTAKVVNLGPLALIQPLLQQLDVSAIIDRHLPPDPQQEYSHGQVLSLLLAGRLAHPTALVNIAGWAEHSGASLLWNLPADKLNDDRLGRALDAFFEQRHSILASITTQALHLTDMSLERLHFDTTHLLFHGTYEDSQPRPTVGLADLRGDGQLPPAHIGHGYVCPERVIQVGLSAIVDAQGALPVFGQCLDGQYNGRPAIREQFKLLQQHLPLPPSLLLVSDRGTYSAAHVHALATAGYHALCAVPLVDFQAIYDTHTAQLHWQPASFLSCEQQRRRAGHSALPQDDYQLAVQRHELAGPPGGTPLQCRLIFVRSSASVRGVREHRRQNVAKIQAGLATIAARLERGSARCTSESANKQVLRLLGKRAAARYFRWQVVPLTPAECAALPPPTGRGHSRPRYRLEFHYDAAAAQADERFDGLSVLLTSAPLTRSADELFTIYKQQNFVELLHHQWKTPLAVRPVFLKSPRRVEALVSLLQLALQAYQVLERRYRQTVAADAPASEHRMTAESLLRQFRVYGLVVTRQAVGQVVQATRLTTEQRRILNQLSLPTPAAILARVLAPIPTD
jgi:transposase